MQLILDTGAAHTFTFLSRDDKQDKDRLMACIIAMQTQLAQSGQDAFDTSFRSAEAGFYPGSCRNTYIHSELTGFAGDGRGTHVEAIDEDASGARPLSQLIKQKVESNRSLARMR